MKPFLPILFKFRSLVLATLALLACNLPFAPKAQANLDILVPSLADFTIRFDDDEGLNEWRSATSLTLSTPFTADYSAVGETTLTTTIRFPQGQRLVVAPPTGFSSPAIFIRVTLDSGTSNNFQSNNVIAIEGNAAAQALTPLFSTTQFDQDGTSNLLIEAFYSSLSVGTVYEFESITLTATVPAAYNGVFDARALTGSSILEVRASTSDLTADTVWAYLQSDSRLELSPATIDLEEGGSTEVTVTRTEPFTDALEVQLESALTSPQRTILSPIGDDSSGLPTFSPGNLVSTTLTDTFAYNPATPTSPLPENIFSDSNNYQAVFEGYGTPAVLRYTLPEAFEANPGSLVIFDLYGRSECCKDRDDDIDLILFNGSFDPENEVARIEGAAIGENTHGRGSIPLPQGGTFDRFQVIGNDSADEGFNRFALFELRVFVETYETASLVTLPATATIPAGQASATFTATALDDNLYSQPVSITLAATGGDLAPASAEMVVTSDDSPTLTVEIPGGTAIAGPGQVTVSHNLRDLSSRVILSADITPSGIVSLPAAGGGGDDFESGDFSALPYVSPHPTYFWSIQTDSTFNGTYAARAPMNTPNNGTVDLWVTAEVVDGTFSFARRVSSERNYDFLEFYIDDVFKWRWSGEAAWAEIFFEVTAGTRTFRWRYVKDGTNKSGQDTAWIDSIRFPGGGLTIPAGSRTATFDLLPAEDQEGVVTLTFTGTVPGSPETAFTGGSLIASVGTDALTLAVADSSLEEGGSTEVTVTRTEPFTDALVVTLSATVDGEATSAITLPATVTIPDGQASSTFTATARSDTFYNLEQEIQVTLEASAAEFFSGAASILVNDDDSPVLGVDIAGGATITDSTQVTVSHNLEDTSAAVSLSLNASPTGIVNIPASLVIPVGSRSATFALDLGEETGNVSLTVSGSLPGMPETSFSGGSVNATVENATVANLPISPFINYQGYIEEDGVPVANAIPARYRAYFFITDARDGGDVLWAEEQQVDIYRGVFSAFLGNGSILLDESSQPYPKPSLASVFASGDRWIRFELPALGLAGAGRSQLVGASAQAVIAGSVSPGGITADQLAEGAITSALLAPASVTTASLSLGAVTSEAIAPGAVTGEKVADGAITTAHLNPASMDGVIRGFGNVTVAEGTLTSRVLADGSLRGTNFMAGSLTPNLVDPALLEQIAGNNRTVVSGRQLGRTVGAENLAEGFLGFVRNYTVTKSSNYRLVIDDVRFDEYVAVPIGYWSTGSFQFTQSRHPQFHVGVQLETRTVSGVKRWVLVGITQFLTNSPTSVDVLFMPRRLFNELRGGRYTP